MANGNGAGDLRNAPVWAKLVFIYGITGAIAGWLVYIGGNNIPQIRMDVSASRIEQQATYKALVDFDARATREFAEIKTAIIWVCTTLADNEAERKDCFRKLTQ